MDGDKLKDYMPIPYLLHKIQRARLKNKDITILCNNCLGGGIIPLFRCAIFISNCKPNG